jgi:hypothetical protein
MEHWENDSDREKPNYLRKTGLSATYPPYIPYGLAWNRSILDEEYTQETSAQHHRVKRNKLWLQTEIFLEYILGYILTQEVTSLFFVHHYWHKLLL